jgi:EAL domain-containing protein (putative c-di-GMP-specific phosphodiesterase class I)
LKLELTENIIIGRPEIASQILNSLIGLGGSLALDDFGTAYSGLDYLQRFPIATMKIDRLFISQVLTSARTRKSSAHRCSWPIHWGWMSWLKGSRTRQSGKNCWT